MMERNFIRCGGLHRAGIVPAGNFWRRDHHTNRSGQRRRMQRLANMANRILSRAVLVQEAATGGEIEQRQADKSRSASPQRSGTQVGEVSLHASADYTTLPRFDGANQLSVAYLATSEPRVLDPATILS